MTTKLRERLPDLVGALCAILVGLLALRESYTYDMGSLTNMGPGYFPSLLAIGMIVLGLLLVFTALRMPPAGFVRDGLSLWPVMIICASLIAFALLIERFGIIPAIFASVFLSTFASDNRNIPRSLLLAAITAVCCAGLFVYLLGLSMKVFAI